MDSVNCAFHSKNECNRPDPNFLPHIQIHCLGGFPLQLLPDVLIKAPRQPTDSSNFGTSHQHKPRLHLYTTEHCTAVQWSAVECSGEQWRAVQCRAVQCNALYCTPLQPSILYYHALMYYFVLLCIDTLFILEQNLTQCRTCGQPRALQSLQ